MIEEAILAVVGSVAIIAVTIASAQILMKTRTAPVGGVVYLIHMGVMGGVFHKLGGWESEVIQAIFGGGMVVLGFLIAFVIYTNRQPQSISQSRR